MNKKLLAIYDSEEKYAYGLMEFLSSKQNIPFRIHIFTKGDKFREFGRKEDIECLLISERVYNETIKELNIPHIIILSESKKVLDNTLHHVDKYQSCERIYKEIIKYYSENAKESARIIQNLKKRMKIIGIYTPIGRCLQTTFAFTLGQILSVDHKTLYLNFERYSGLSNMLRKEFSNDIADLMYYFECAKEKLTWRIESMVENINGLDYIPPVNIYQNLAGISKDKWLDLFAAMDEDTGYEYLILDLTDGMLDLWDVLRACDVVYTISRNDALAVAKMEQYERALTNSEYVDIVSKTKKCHFPLFKNLPERFDELTRSDLALYIKNHLIDDIYALKGTAYE